MCTYIHGYLHPCWFCIGIINITWPQSHTHLRNWSFCCKLSSDVVIHKSWSQCSIFVAQVPLTLTQDRGCNEPTVETPLLWMNDQSTWVQQGAPCGSTTSSCGRIDGAGPFFEDVGWHDDCSLKPTNCAWKLGGWKMNFLLGFRPIFKGVCLRFRNHRWRWWRRRRGRKLPAALKKTVLGGGFRYFLCSPTWRTSGEMIQFEEHIFPNGLVQPPTSADWRFPSIHENSRKLVRYQRSLFRPRRRLLKCHRHNFTGKIQLPKTKENMCWKVLFMGQI